MTYEKVEKQTGLFPSDGEAQRIGLRAGDLVDESRP
jgi:hypothetical protein